MGNKFDFESFESFRHGLIVSKLWLCEELEKIITPLNTKHEVHILGSWTNILGFMMLVRNHKLYSVVHGYDIEPTAIDIANSINNAWMFEEPKVHNHATNINDIDYSLHGENRLYINCSIEHLTSRDWYSKVPADSMVCLQSTNMNIEGDPWDINDYTPNIETILERYPMKKILYQNIKNIRYNHFGYDRFMIIGVK